MFGFLNDIREAIATFWDLVGAIGVFIKLGMVGLVAAVLAWVVGNIIKPFTDTGALAAVAVIGLLIVGGASSMSYFKDAAALRAEAMVKKLEAENKAKAAKVEELQLTNAALNAFLNREREVAKENADARAKLNAIIGASKDNPDCALPEEFLDGLDGLH